MIKPPYSSRSRSNHKPLLFHGDSTERLKFWRQMRDSLDVSREPLQDLMQVYRFCPLTITKTNFFDTQTWSQPWQQIESNEYNAVDRLVHMWHTLRLTKTFEGKTFDLIQAEHKSKIFYVLCVDNQFCEVENFAIYTQKEFDKEHISKYNHKKI